VFVPARCLLTKPAPKLTQICPRVPLGAILNGVRLGIRSTALFLGAIVLLALPAAQADELKLKDGSKIVGTIVGYEEDSFKVQTSYGFAVVKKDQVLSISIAGSPLAAAPARNVAKDSEKGSVNTPTEKKPDVEKTAPPALAKAPAPEATKPIVAASKPAVPAAAPATLPVAPPSPTPTVAVSAPPPKPAPPETVRPEPIRENVTGNVYTNLTYGFSMYKPPSWNVIAAAPSVMPGAIAAMGTEDEATYLLVGQNPAGKTVAMEMDATERRLRDVLENFRPIGEEHITVSGEAAIEQHFRGTVDQHDWSGIVVLVPHGKRIYTIFAMTRADDDLVQIQENVIARTIASLQFTAKP